MVALYDTDDALVRGDEGSAAVVDRWPINICFGLIGLTSAGLWALLLAAAGVF